MEYKLIDNQLKAEDFIRLKVSAGFRERCSIVMLNRKTLKNMTFDLQEVMFFEKFDVSMTFGGGKSHVICKFSA